MSAKYEPGTLAAVSTHVRESARAVRRGGVWHFLDDEGYALDAYVSDVRPLVVLDVKDVPGLLATLRDSLGFMYAGQPNALRLQDAIDQIEAQTRPPKPAEPTGLGAVVEDSEGVRWVRIDALENPWATDAGISFEDWDVIDAVRVLSEGVQP